MDSELGQADLAALRRIALISTGIKNGRRDDDLGTARRGGGAGRALTDKATPSWLVDRLKRLARRTSLEPSLASEILEFAQASKTMFDVRNDNLHNVWVSLEEGKVVRLRSVLVDGAEGPEFQAEVAVAGVGQLAAQADIMERFA